MMLQGIQEDGIATTCLKIAFGRWAAERRFPHTRHSCALLFDRVFGRGTGKVEEDNEDTENLSPSILLAPLLTFISKKKAGPCMAK